MGQGGGPSGAPNKQRNQHTRARHQEAGRSEAQGSSGCTGGVGTARETRGALGGFGSGRRAGLREDRPPRGHLRWLRLADSCGGRSYPDMRERTVRPASRGRGGGGGRGAPRGQEKLGVYNQKWNRGRGAKGGQGVRHCRNCCELLAKPNREHPRWRSYLAGGDSCGRGQSSRVLAQPT